MAVFYEIDIVAHKRSPDFFYMECKHGSRTLNLLSRSTRTCRVEVSFTDRIEGKKKFRRKNTYFFWLHVEHGLYSNIVRYPIPTT